MKNVTSNQNLSPSTPESISCTYLGVWVVRGLETEILDAHLFEEYTHEACVPHREHHAHARKKERKKESIEYGPIRSASVRPRSATTPSTWWNSARWVASIVSLRNTRSILNNFAGRKPSSLRSV